jgi:hypothetical protein
LLPRAAVATALGFSSLRLADIQRTDVLMHALDCRMGHQPQVAASGSYPLLGFSATIEMLQHRLLSPDTSQLYRPFSVLKRLMPG